MAKAARTVLVTGQLAGDAEAEAAASPASWPVPAMT